MATKTITISEEAYNLLRNIKEAKESFTEVIVKIAKKDPLSELAGILTKTEAAGLREHIRISRSEAEERLKQTRAKLE